MRIVAIAMLLTACGAGDPAPRVGTGTPAQPVAADNLRVRAIDPAENWESAWLDTEGWDFFGYELEAGSNGRVRITWSCASREIADVRCALRAGEPVLFVYGIRTRPPLKSGRVVECPSCGARTKLIGSALPDDITCRRCKTTVPVDLDWKSEPSRELRVMLRGNYAQPRQGKRLDIIGRSTSTELGKTTWMQGKIRARDVPARTGYCDPPALMRRDRWDFPAGAHRPFSRRIHLPDSAGSSRSASWMNGKLTFHHTAGDVKIEGNEKTYRILMDGQEIALDDYPYPVWDFDVVWTLPKN